MDECLRSYLAYEGAADDVVALLQPEFVEHAGGVFLSRRFSQRLFDEFWAASNGSMPATEYTLNHVHLWDLFSDTTNDVAASAALRALVDQIEATLNGQLELRYPDRTFCVELTDEPDDYGPTIGFYTRA